MKTTLIIFLAVHIPAILAICYYGTTSSNPGQNCQDIIRMNPGCFGMSGYYWVNCSSSGTVQVYCDMESLQGGWIRAASENFTSGTGCLCGWQNITVNGQTYCTVASNDQDASWTIDTICPYSEIRGYVLVDQRGRAEAFFSNPSATNRADDIFVDGVVFLTNTSLSHLFTYAVGVPFSVDVDRSCECDGSTYISYPYFLEYDYMCDTGYSSSNYNAAQLAPRTLFTGEGCETESGCCYVAGAPWFYKSIAFTTDEKIKVKIVADKTHADELILVKELGLYVR